MGNKSSKGLGSDISEADLARLGKGLSKEELACCLASVSNMAHTGVPTAVPEIRVNDQPPVEVTLKPETLHVIKRKLRHRLHRQMSTNQEEALSEHVHKQLALLDGLDSQDDTSDWASMRSWLVWCLHNNLNDDVAEEEPSRGSPTPSSSRSSSRSSPSGRRQNLTRQMSLDKGKLKLQHGVSSFDSTGSGTMSAQSSFDSGGGAGET